jgi:hypothetical protein
MHCHAIPPHNVKKSPLLNVKSYNGSVQSCRTLYFRD